MKTFQEFCEDAYIQENLLQTVTNFFSPKPKPSSIQSPKPKPRSQQVLAYKNYKPGVLNKSTGQFIPRQHTPKEQERYGWKPVNTSSYGPGDTPSQSYNTGRDKVQRTASGVPFTSSTTGVAVPYKYKEGQVPKGVWAGTPSIPFGTKLQFTQKPTGTNTRVINAPAIDTGNFGSAGKVNKKTNFDLTQSTARQLTGNPKITPTEYGKQPAYVRIAPTSSSVTKPTPKK